MSVLNGRHLSLGPRVPRFEQNVAEYMGAKFAVAVNSGTSALHLCVKAAGIQPGDIVITTPFSFVASANCILFEQARPVFVDIDPETYNIDPARIEAALDKRTRAILPVHVFGRPCNMPAVMEIARTHQLAVIEDACEAIGARVAGRRAGTFGDTGVFAFYPNKQMTTGEGGMIVTDSERTAALCRSWRNQGRAADGGWLQHERLGYNYRLSDINCAIGIEQVRRLPQILAARARVAQMYNTALARIGGIHRLPITERGCEISWFVYVVRLADEFTQEDRDTVLDKLRERGVACSNYFSPIHLQPFYREMFGYRYGDFPVTERVAERTIALPFFNSLAESEVEYVAQALEHAVAGLHVRGVVAMAMG